MTAPEKASGLLTHLSDEPWREVILLYSGLVGEWATAFLEVILDQPDDAAHNLLILAGQCLAEDVRVAPETRGKAVGRLEAAFQAATDPLTFARLGETLAALGGEDVFALFGRVLETGALPSLSRLYQQGLRGDLESVIPPLSPEAWSTFMTGTHPG